MKSYLIIVFLYFRSLHHLQGALPILSSAANQDQLEEETSGDQLKLNDPLREFLVEQQKISDAKNETSVKKEVEQGSLGQIKGNAKKFLRKGIRNEAIGFEAIREEEETSSVAIKAAVSTTAVSTRKSVNKSPEKLVSTAVQTTEIEEGHSEVKHREIATPKIESIPQESSNQPDESSVSTLSSDESKICSPVPSLGSSLYECAPSPHSSSEYSSVEENVIENQVLPPQAFVPMVQVIEEQVLIPRFHLLRSK